MGVTPESLAESRVWLGLEVNFEFKPWTFPGGPGRSSGGSRLGGSPAAGALGSDLRDKGLEEAEEFSWEVCFSSVGISGPGAPALAEGSDLQQSEMLLPLGAGFPETLFPTPLCLFLSECWVGFSTLGSCCSARGAT